MNNEDTCAPIALFAYMRPDHLATTVRSLAGNPEAARTELTIFCDAAKKPEHQSGVEAVRRFAASIDGFASVTIVERDRNFGLARSIIEGVTQVIKQRDRVIVLEDDLHLSPHFLRYMNDALDTYAGDEEVASIHGYCYPVAAELPETFFLRGADCWGWATWSRSWRHFRGDGAALLRELISRGLQREFDMDGYFSYTAMLRDQIVGKNDSWAIRWHASCFLENRLTLYPGRSLVHNIGNDGSGTHCDDRDDYLQTVSAKPIRVQRLPLAVNPQARRQYVEFLRRLRLNPFQRALRAMRRNVRIV